MGHERQGLRWGRILPVGALIAAAVMVGFAWMASASARDRARLALDGRVLGVGHRAELSLREQGLESASEVLKTALKAGRGDVGGLRLISPDGGEVASAGAMPEGNSVRAITLFLGPEGRVGGPSTGFGPGSGGRGGGWGGEAGRGERRGRGRYTLEISVQQDAGAPPLAARLILPVAGVAGVVLVGLALLAGRLLERQRLEEMEAAQRRRMEELGRAGAGLAHQLRTPLATIKGSCQIVAEDPTDEAAPRRLEAALEQVDRMERMLGQLLDFARPPQPEPQRISMETLLEEIEGRWERVIGRAESGCGAFADREHLVQIIENLVTNALAVSPEDGRVEVEASVRHGRTVVTVTDRGPGLPGDPEALFQPYVTHRADGSGLGLPIARNLAEANGGTLVLQPGHGGGTMAVLELPTGEAGK